MAQAVMVVADDMPGIVSKFKGRINGGAYGRQAAIWEAVMRSSQAVRFGKAILR